jgi:hypothetical protein
MLARIVAALLIATSALVWGDIKPGFSTAGAEPRGRGYRGRGRSRGWHNPDPNPLGAIVGGIFGGWLAQQMAPPPPPPPPPFYDDEEEDDDDAPRDRREGR